MSMRPSPRHCRVCDYLWMGNIDDKCANCYPNVFKYDDQGRKPGILYTGRPLDNFVCVASGLIINTNKTPPKLLLAQRDDFHSHFYKRWEGPGGGIEVGETPRQAVIREAKEECGIDIQVVKYLGGSCVSKPKNFKSLIVFHFLCTTTQEPKPLDCLNPTWFDLNVLADDDIELMTSLAHNRKEFNNEVMKLFPPEHNESAWDGAGGDRGL